MLSTFKAVIHVSVILILGWLCGVFPSRRLMLSLTLIFSPASYCDYLAWGQESWFICFSCICMFILHALRFVSVFFSSWYRGVGCGLWLWMDVSFNFWHMLCRFIFIKPLYDGVIFCTCIRNNVMVIAFDWQTLSNCLIRNRRICFLSNNKDSSSIV